MSTPQSIQEQLQSLEPSAIIELFQLELTQAVQVGRLTGYAGIVVLREALYPLED